MWGERRGKKGRRGRRKARRPDRGKQCTATRREKGEERRRDARSPPAELPNTPLVAALRGSAGGTGPGTAVGRQSCKKRKGGILVDPRSTYASVCQCPKHAPTHLLSSSLLIPPPSLNVAHRLLVRHLLAPRQLVAAPVAAARALAELALARARRLRVGQQLCVRLCVCV